MGKKGFARAERAAEAPVTVCLATPAIDNAVNVARVRAVKVSFATW